MIETLNIMSESLKEGVKVKIVTPSCKHFKALIILLHGKTEYEGETRTIDNMISRLELNKLSERFQVMIAVPYITRNCYYISTEGFDCKNFISKELISFMTEKYPVTSDTEMILAGVSMGGYGAVLIGSTTTVFSKIISVSGAFISNDIIMGNQEVWGNMKPHSKSVKETFLSYFLPLSVFKESLDNIENVIAETQNKLSFYFTCGNKDWLYSRNLKLLQLMKDAEHMYSFFEIDGGEHNNECFRESLWLVIEGILGEKQDTYLPMK